MKALMRWCVAFLLLLGCSDDSSAVEASVDALVDNASDASDASDGSDATMSMCPPSFIEFRINGTQSELDAGWTGAVHGLKVSDGAVFTLEVVECDPACRLCTVRGPVNNLMGAEVRRCVGETNVVCTSSQECTSGACRFALGGPLNFMVSISASCVQMHFEPTAAADPTPIIGTVDLLGGTVQFDTFSLGVQIQASAECARCEGSVCVGGPQDGEACVAMTTGAVVAEDKSLDCPPPSGIDFSFGLQISDLGTDGRRRRTASTDPACSMPMGASCWCGQCAADPMRACANDAECGADGPCSAPMVMGLATRPNNCGGMPCQPNADGNHYCGGDAARFRCFPSDELIASGSTANRGDGFVVTLATVSCLPSVDAGLVDAVSGFPGPVSFELEAIMTVVP